MINVTKEKLETLIKELPDAADIEEVMYRLYLLQKIETGETAIKDGKTLSLLTSSPTGRTPIGVR